MSTDDHSKNNKNNKNNKVSYSGSDRSVEGAKAPKESLNKAWQQIAGSFKTASVKAKDKVKAVKEEKEKKEAEYQANLQKLENYAESGDQLLLGQIAVERIYNSQQSREKKLWITIMCLIGGLFISSMMNFSLGSQSKIDTVLVKQNAYGQILGFEQAQSIDPNSIKPGMALYFIEQFIKSARSVVTDQKYQTYMVNEAYALTQGAASKTLKDYIDSNNPYQLSSTQEVSIQWDSFNPNVNQSNTTQVVWTEIARDPKSGTILSKQKYTGVFTYYWNLDPNDVAHVVMYNPMGFYITNFSWSKNLNDS